MPEQQPTRPSGKPSSPRQESKLSQDEKAEVLHEVRDFLTTGDQDFQAEEPETPEQDILRRLD